MESLTATDKILQALSQLKKAIIDTSSILYIQKAGYFDVLNRAVQLYSIPEVIAEMNTRVTGLTIIRNSESRSSLPTDQKLIACALENRLTMIAEDRQILMAIQGAKAPYYNALMMLNLLLLSQKIDDNGYQRHLEALKKFARYSETVWEFGENIYKETKEYGHRRRSNFC